MTTIEPIKVLLVDDEMLIRSGLAILLDSYEEIDIVGQAADGQEAIDFCEQETVDVILMDIRMPEVNGIEATKVIKDRHPEINILILTTFKDAEYISQAMKLGASGYLLKDSSEEEIFEGIKMAKSNNIILDGKLSHSLATISAQANAPSFDGKAHGLSEKEIEIIRLVASGYSNQEIADTLFLSIGTIKNNVTIILSKLALRDRTQLAIFAFKQNVIGNE